MAFSLTIGTALKEAKVWEISTADAELWSNPKTDDVTVWFEKSGLAYEDPDYEVFGASVRLWNEVIVEDTNTGKIIDRFTFDDDGIDDLTGVQPTALDSSKHYVYEIEECKGTVEFLLRENQSYDRSKLFFYAENIGAINKGVCAITAVWLKCEEVYCEGVSVRGWHRWHFVD